MRILLLGEFSRLHNSLKEGLVALGHEVILLGNGDGFKNYPVDLSTRATFSESRIGRFLRKGIHKITKIDIARIEFGIRFYFHLSKLSGFDVVQLINEAPIQTYPSFERFLLKKIFRQNQKVFLLCCGIDYTVARYLTLRKPRYSVLNPYFEEAKKAKEYQYLFEFLTPNHQKTHQLVHQNSNGIIASDLDYVAPFEGNSKFLGMIPNPINTEKISEIHNPITDKIVLFMGINKSSYLAKGIPFFEKALAIIEKKYPEKVQIVVVQNLPYDQYIQLFNKAHVVLDQVYSFDQGYNALEAMACGKVVLTGAEKEFEQYYNLTQKVAINALPEVDYIVKELSYLIENPSEIVAIGTNARDFIKREHNYLSIAQQYIRYWGKNV